MGLLLKVREGKSCAGKAYELAWSCHRRGFFCLKEFPLFSLSSTFILFGVGLRWHETDPNVKVQDVTVVVSTERNMQ